MRKEMYLRRYTDLASVIYLLRTQKITLLDPQSWIDRNDSYYLELYKKKKKLESVLALCFTTVSERYHFWRVFGAGSSGIRVRFRREALLAAVEKQPGLRMGSVEYLRLHETPVAVSKLPFVKRYAFKDEKEFRMIYESDSDQLQTLDIPIPLSCIDKIVLNPWLHPALFSHVKGVLNSIKGYRSINIEHSRLIDNETSKRAGDRAIREAK
jgi:hypothetical protein